MLVCASSPTPATAPRNELAAAVPSSSAVLSWSCWTCRSSAIAPYRIDALTASSKLAARPSRATRPTFAISSAFRRDALADSSSCPVNVAADADTASSAVPIPGKCSPPNARKVSAAFPADSTARASAAVRKLST